LTAIGTTGYAEIEGLSFHPTDGKLYGFAKGDGLLEIDTATAASKLIVPTKIQVEDLTWNNDGSLLYAAQDTNLYKYDGHTLDFACDLPGHTEALEMLPDNHLLIGVHGKSNILDFQVMDLATCNLVQGVSIPTSDYNDVEGIAWQSCESLEILKTLNTPENSLASNTFNDLQTFPEFEPFKKEELDPFVRMNVFFGTISSSGECVKGSGEVREWGLIQAYGIIGVGHLKDPSGAYIGDKDSDRGVEWLSINGRHWRGKGGGAFVYDGKWCLKLIEIVDES